jgi:hypothetical protein
MGPFPWKAIRINELEIFNKITQYKYMAEKVKVKRVYRNPYARRHRRSSDKNKNVPSERLNPPQAVRVPAKKDRYICRVCNRKLPILSTRLWWRQ